MHLSFINYDQDDAATTELHSQKQHQKSNTTEDNIIKNDLPILSSNGMFFSIVFSSIECLKIFIFEKSIKVKRKKE